MATDKILSIETESLRSVFEEHPDLLTEIGRIVSLWGTVSSMTRRLADEFANDPIEELKAFDDLGGDSKRFEFVLSKLKPLRSDPRISRIYKALGRLNALANERNIIIHGHPIRAYHREPVIRKELCFKNPRAKTKAGQNVPAIPLLQAHLPKLKEHSSELFDAIWSNFPEIV